MVLTCDQHVRGSNFSNQKQVWGLSSLELHVSFFSFVCYRSEAQTDPYSPDYQIPSQVRGLMQESSDVLEGSGCG